MVNPESYRVMHVRCGLPTNHPEHHKVPCSGLNEFYKKGCQEKSFPLDRTPRRFFVSRSSPLPVNVPLDSLERLVVACFPFPWLSSSGDDDANRVLGLGKRTWYLNVNHGSIRGSWPIAISGYPRRHSVH